MGNPGLENPSSGLSLAALKFPLTAEKNTSTFTMLLTVDKTFEFVEKIPSS